MTQSWLEIRRSYVGASEVGALFGVEIPEQDYLSEFALYHEKRGGGEPREDSAALRWGTRHEASIFAALGEDEGLEVDRWGTGSFLLNCDIVHTDRAPLIVDRTARASCTPDGLGEDDAGLYLVEAKTTNWRAWAAWREDFEERHGCAWAPEHPNAEDVFPASYQLQITQQMGLTGIRRGMLVVLVDGRELRRAWVPFRVALWAEIQRRIVAFWTRVETGDEPEPVYTRSGDARAIESLYRRRPVEAAADWTGRPGFVELCERYRVASAEEKAAGERKSALGMELRHLLIDAPTSIRAGALKVSSALQAATPARVVTEADIGRYVAGFVEPDKDGNHYARGPSRPLRITEPKGKSA